MAVASFYVRAALIGLLFPLDIMMAADSNPKLVYQQGGWVAGGLVGVERILWCWDLGSVQHGLAAAELVGCSAEFS